MGIQISNEKEYVIGKGDIIRGEQKSRDKAYHPIIYWKDNDYNDGRFYGVMLTTSTDKDFPGNILLPKEYFKMEQSQTYSEKPQYFVNRIFIKLENWGPFKKCGEVKAKGIDLIESTLLKDMPITFDQYEEMLNQYKKTNNL